MTAPRHLLKASHVDGAVVLSTMHHETMFALLGTSMKTNAPTGSEGLIQLVVVPEKGMDGIVAIHIKKTVYTRNSETEQSFTFFIKITWRDGVPIAELDQSWVSVEKLSYLAHNRIELVLPPMKRNRNGSEVTYPGGCRVSSSSHRRPSTTDAAVVPDADLLCRYLIGTATYQDVARAIMREKVKQVEPTRLEKMTRQFRIVAAKSSWVEGICDALTEEVRTKSADADAFASLLFKFMQMTDKKWLRRVFPWVAVWMLRKLLTDKYATSDGVMYGDRLRRYQVKAEMETGRTSKESPDSTMTAPVHGH